MAEFHRVVASGPGYSTVPEGTLLALKISAPDRLSRERMAIEAEILLKLQEVEPAPPCPRLLDVVEAGDRIAGMVMEWCPTDLERWWGNVLARRDAVEPLCRALAEVCRRAAEFHTFMAARGIRSVHADIKPRNVVLSNDGRWLLADFGASESRPIEEEAWEATSIVLGTENFVAPEMLFNARKHVPEAMDTWSVALSLLVLMRLRTARLQGRPSPPEGTHSPVFRCQRTTDVLAVRDLDPGRFSARDLDPAAFPTPLRLPDPDRAAVREALSGLFFDPAREEALAVHVLAVLDRALAVDPARRYVHAEDLADAFDGIVARFWELEGSLSIPAPLPPHL
ncbi:MAG: protein kinase [Deltaproteobacteria bacterium]|nr:protein kinase [Deltaproteobacteria bacterium]